MQCDFCSGVPLKSKTYCSAVQYIVEFKRRETVEIAGIREEPLKKVLDNLKLLLYLKKKVDGGHIENILNKRKLYLVV